jgi:predicted lipase
VSGAGHSLGAAIAVLCAWDLHVFQQREVAAVYTYGQPRIGNFPFALAYVVRPRLGSVWS